MSLTALIQPPLIRVPQNIAVMDIAGARGWLGAEFSEDDILDLITTGDLAWAWNVAQLSAKRMEARVLSACVCSYRDRINKVRSKSPGVPTDDFLANAPFSSIAYVVIPQKHWGKPLMPGIDLADAMLFGSDLLQDLIADGSLKATTEARRGRGGSALLKMPGVLDFLRVRRIT